MIKVLRVDRPEITKEAVDRCKTYVSRADSVVAVFFQVIEEGDDFRNSQGHKLKRFSVRRRTARGVSLRPDN